MINEEKTLKGVRENFVHKEIVENMIKANGVLYIESATHPNAGLIIEVLEVDFCVRVTDANKKSTLVSISDKSATEICKWLMQLLGVDKEGL